MGENDELIKDFLIKCYEDLDRLDQDFIALEKEPENHKYLHNILKAIHGIRRGSGYFGFVKLQSLAQNGEQLLGKVRDGHITIQDELASNLQKMFDVIREILTTIETTHKEGERDDRALIQQLTKLQTEIA